MKGSSSGNLFPVFGLRNSQSLMPGVLLYCISSRCNEFAEDKRLCQALHRDHVRRICRR